MLACGPSLRDADRTAASPATPAAGDDDHGARVFDPARVLSIDITLAAKDWDSLRNQGRDAEVLATDCRGVAEKVYRYFPARVTIDGTTLDGVGVRKKGFLGSLSVLRPSLKLKFDAFAEEQRYQGLRRLTLNNNKQDRALMRSCLIYRVFRDAGLPAPRCNFARVTVNGTSLGIYSNVEAIKKPFLRDHFGDASGNLYEGQVADFAPDWSARIERKSNREPGNRGDIAAVEAALRQPDDKFLAAFSALFDYEEFLTFWALETLTGHWDGYSSNRNNFYLYGAPSDGKLHFIPWGADVGFTMSDPFHPDRPTSVSAEATLTRRLYANPAARADYVARMGKLLATVWNEAALRAEVDRIDTLLGGAPHDDGVAEIRRFIGERKAKLAAELAAGGGDWNQPARVSPCMLRGSQISGTFTTTFGNLEVKNPLGEGRATLELSLAGKPIELPMLGVVSGRDHKSASEPVVRYVGLSDGKIYVLQLFFEEPLFKAGVTRPFHGFATWGLLLELVDMQHMKVRGLLGAGEITLEQAGTAANAPVKGSFSGIVIERLEEAPAQ